MELSDRITQAIDYLRYNGVPSNHDDIAKKLNRDRSNVTKAINGNMRYLTKPFLADFATAYSDYINEEWLLTGEGRMEKSSHDMRPHYDAKASAGFMDGISEGKMSAEFREMAIPLLNYDFSIDADGDSMLPKIESGDTLLCRMAKDRLNPPVGKICVIDTKDGAVVKEVKSINEETITLHSINPDYTDYEVEFVSILGVAEVVGLVRAF